MITLTSLAEFSRNHCISICSFLVPANLLTTLLIVRLSWVQASTRQVLGIAVIAALFAITLFLHVGTWFLAGVVMPPTFILLALGSTCLVIDYIALTNIQKIQEAWQLVRVMVRQMLKLRVTQA